MVVVDVVVIPSPAVAVAVTGVVVGGGRGALAGYTREVSTTAQAVRPPEVFWERFCCDTFQASSACVRRSKLFFLPHDLLAVSLVSGLVW